MTTDALNQALTDIGEIVNRVWELHYSPEDVKNWDGEQGSIEPGTPVPVDVAEQAIDSVCGAYRILAEANLSAPMPEIYGNGSVSFRWRLGYHHVEFHVHSNWAQILSGVQSWNGSEPEELAKRLEWLITGVTELPQ